MAFEFLPGDPIAQPGFGRNEFIWPKSGKLQAEFIREFSKQVEGIWSGKFGIFGQAHDPRTDVDFNLKLNVSVIERKEKPIWRVLVSKDPKDAINLRGSVCGPGTHHEPDICAPNKPGDETGSLEISGSLVEPLEMLNAVGDKYKIWFKPDTAKLDLVDILEVRVNDVIKRLRETNSTWSIRITGLCYDDVINAGPSGRRTVHPAIELARERVIRVRNFFEHNGVPRNKITGSINNSYPSPQNGSDKDPGFVDVIMSTQRQSALAHEAGHLFGLGDEYANDAERIGDPLVDEYYIKLIADWGFDVPTRGPSRSIMSNGNTVLPRHYTPFLDVLQQNFSQYEWSLTPNP